MQHTHTPSVPASTETRQDADSGDADFAGRVLRRDQLRQAIANGIDHARLSQRHVAVLMVSLERADKLGTFFGVSSDAIMSLALRRLSDSLRLADRYLAVTDEKICVLLPNLKSTAQAWLAAGKIQQVLETPFEIDSESISVRPVIGIAAYPDHAELPEELVVHADIAAGIARSRDIAQHVFQNEDRDETDVYVGLDSELREAIRGNRLMLHYQPQIDFETGQCAAAEALLRWKSVEHGDVSPMTIVRVAEAHGIINSLTGWIMNTALREHAGWVREGFEGGISINLSTLSLKEEDLPEIIGQTLGVWGTDPSRVTLEITESHSLGDEDRSLDVLRRIRALGVRLAVDDFGTGYASLSYVKNFPLNELKIDKLFVQHMRDTKGDQQIVQSVIDLAHNFDLTVVAEGIEDDATYKALKKMGCDLAQGYVVSRAMPGDEFIEWIRARAKP